MREPARFRRTAHGRIGFMSTQRRESRQWAGSSMDAANGSWCLDRDSVTLCAHARAHGQTASPAFSAGLATNSLRSDHRNTQLVRLVGESVRCGWPPLGLSCRTQAVPSAFIKVILSAHPFPPGLARLLRACLQLLAARGRRAERCDGKRNLYFQHAA